MQSGQAFKPSGQSGRGDRREQLVACAVEAVAELGLARASLAEIASRAGVSKGVVSYHFSGKDDLIEHVIACVYEKGASVTRPAIEAASTATEELRATIEARVDFYREYRTHMLALLDIWQNFRGPDGEPRLGEAAHEEELRELEAILRRGQETGEFRDFPLRVMAVTLRQSFDAVLLQLAGDPELDLDEYRHGLADLFDRATRADTTASEPQGA